MNGFQKFLMMVLVGGGAAFLGLTFGANEQAFGLVIGTTQIWFSVGFGIVGGLAGLGLMFVLWLAYDAVVDYLG